MAIKNQFDNVMWDDVVEEQALVSMIQAHEEWIEEHQDNGCKEKDFEIQLNRRMIKLLSDCIRQNSKIADIFASG